MDYTVKKVAQLSGVSIRTLHHYDKIGLLRPAYISESGYRYYQKEQLLMLQQILFFKELGFPLAHIHDILNKSDFDKVSTLRSHKQLLQKTLTQTRALLKTIENTINHLQGKTIMCEKELFNGFSPEQQAAYEQELITTYGTNVNEHIQESKHNMKNWTAADWQKTHNEFTSICQELANLMQTNYQPNSPEVQHIIARHHAWLKKFWTPNKESYAGLGAAYASETYSNVFMPYHPQLASFMAKAITIFAAHLK